MNRVCLFLFFLPSCLLLATCSNAVRKPMVIANIEKYNIDGMYAYSNAEWNKAEYFFTKALRLYQGVDNQEGSLLSYINLAEVTLAMQETSKSKRYLLAAKALAKKDLLKGYNSRILLLLSEMALQKNELMSAEQLLQKILPEFIGNQVMSKPNEIQLAAIANQTKIAFLNNQNAFLWTQRYAHALKKMTNKNADGDARLLRFQARLLLQKGAEDKAELKMQQALSLYKEQISRVGIAGTLFELGQYYRSKQQWNEAQAYFLRSQLVYEYLKNDWKLKRIASILDEVENEGKLMHNRTINSQFLLKTKDERRKTKDERRKTKDERRKTKNSLIFD
ncbi:MAG: hypothetical protein HFP77_00330 [Methylococcales symbiont of Iophon sp. n. MRB-2018]|nr:MAG: hypothetical protein HFP77_00330 [Methylococcales symbiont of Iophon sp. n. MRB-2018]KAF3980769.1 MAG: hypothetical protein HFP76_00395 [Methylococcales symbiont of Iophon sp. n. MRB-2018]